MPLSFWGFQGVPHNYGKKGAREGWKTVGGHRRIPRASVRAELVKRKAAGVKESHADPLRVLVIDDDEILLRLYRATFSRWPFDLEVFTAPNGYEGLLMVGETRPDLLICDLRRPGVSGFQIVRSLATIDRYRDMDIVVVSGLPGESIDANGGIPDRIHLFSKPIDFHRLEVIAQDLLAARRVLEKFPSYGQ
jgi:CheY-like chemotaxis protein